MTHISFTIRSLFDKGDLPDRIRCTRQDLIGMTYTWSPGLGCYLSDAGGDCFMTWYVRRSFGVFFHPLNLIHGDSSSEKIRVRKECGFPPRWCIQSQPAEVGGSNPSCLHQSEQQLSLDLRVTS